MNYELHTINSGPEAITLELESAQKTMSNYYNHLAHTPLDEMFQHQRWDK